MVSPRGAMIAELTWPEIETRIGEGAVAVLPIGAGAKEHGHHLPMATDALTAEHLGRVLAARAPVLVWPPVSYGHYPAFLDYPGSTSLSRPLFEAVIGELLDDLFRAGAGRALIVNTGISTIAPLAAARAAHARAPDIAIVDVYRGPRYLEALAGVQEQERGGHADEAETSILLALAPDSVRMEAATPWTAPLAPGPFQRRDPNAPGYSPAGHHGDPTRATADKGRLLLAAMIEDLLAALVSVPT